MTRVVWVTTEVSAAPTAGGAIRTFQLIRALAQDVDVDVVLIGGQGEEAVVRDAVGARSVSIFQRSAPLAVRLRWLKGWPLTSARTWTPDAARHIRSLTDGGALPVYEHLRTLVYRRPGERCVVALQNVDSEALTEIARLRPTRRRLELARDAMLYKRIESELSCDPTATVVCVSERDRRVLGGDPVVVPNGTDVPRRVPPLAPRGYPLFVGSLNYAPNADAVQWWHDRIAPLLDPEIPALTVVGRGADVHLSALRETSHICLVGEVPTVTGYLAGAGLVVVPLRHGSGTRLKVLEAFAHGRPLVATSKAVEGLAVVHGEHLLIADTARDFAQAVGILWRDGALAARLAAAGRRFAESYDWPLVARRFVESILRDGINR